MDIVGSMEYINSFSKLGAPVTDLLRFVKIMRALGDPQKKLKFVHVAGTNGKGSTVRMIAGALTKAGYRTGEFTSPFIKVYNDRIKIDGVNISDMELAEIVSKVKPVLDGISAECSQFEITTAVAFLYFASEKCDIVVLEAGIGGLLDCTNIIEEPCVSVITSISFDHTAILGNTLEKIAAQKAGIIKKGCPAVLAVQQKKEVSELIYENAVGKGSRFVSPNTERLTVEKCGSTGSRFVYKGYSYAVSMLGRHQIDNALTAIETLDVLKKQGWDKLSYVNIYEGIRSAEVPSRCQVLRRDKPFIIIDGAHNPDGMRALAEFVKTVNKSPRIMICGMKDDKDWQTSVKHIAGYIDVAVCVDGFAPKTVPAEKLASMFRKGEVSDMSRAVPRAVSLAGNTGMVLIAGSLYLASAVQNFTSYELGAN